MLNYFLPSKGKISLDKRDFISQGGEGKIFGHGGIIYKIYHKSDGMIPSAKIKELQVLDHNWILKPIDIILNEKNRPVGFTMKWVKDAYPLCKLFPTSFRNKNGVTPENALALTENIKILTEFIHSKDCLIIDGNEMNYLVSNNFIIPYSIDVNSYQTPHFPATMIMPSIRDWHSKEFSRLSDWFSFAIISCQLFIGIHPYKGTHKNFKKGDIIGRMKANASIFGKNVFLPKPVRDFSHIPVEYMNWYVSLFEDGQRVPPPGVSKLLKIVQVIYEQFPQKSNNFVIKIMQEYSDTIIYHKTRSSVNIVTTKDKKIYLEKKAYKIQDLKTDIIFTPRTLTPIAINIKKENNISLKNLYTEENISIILKASNKIIVENTLYLVYNGELIQINFNETSGKILASVKNSWQIMPKSSIVFNSIIYQNVLGKASLIIPVPEKDSCMMKYMPELDSYRIIYIKRHKNVCIAIGQEIKSRSAENDQLIFRFDASYNNYDCRIVEKIDYDYPNFIVLPSGIVILINQDNQLEIFSANPRSNKVRLIKDDIIDSSMILATDGIRALFYREDKLYSINIR